MAINGTGLSPDLIIHPGETLKEVIEDRGISQEELAIKTGFSAKHVSEVVNCKKDISSKFASALEIALNIPTSFWINLQGIYDREVYELESINNISDEEFKICDSLKEILSYCEKNNIIISTSNKSLKVLTARKFLGITDLSNIDKISVPNVAYRGSNKYNLNVYVLYAWQRLCEYYTNKIVVKNNFNRDKLIDNLGNIKEAMFLDINKAIKKLTNIFEECGIAFAVVKNFTGAPVQGYIQKRNDKVTLCMTIRGSYADIFWFTLFHEIGHLLNDDFETKLLDYVFLDNRVEERANAFARNVLIDENEYKKFIKEGNYTITNIRKFSTNQGVIPSIVIGRMEKEFNDYSFMSSYRVRYKWDD